MQTRSSKNWNFKSGTWDSLNTELINFEEDYPTLSSMPLTVGFEVTMCNDYKSFAPNKLVSMFIDDYVLERFWNKPLNYIERFKGCLATMTPDFSMLIGMPKQIVFQCRKTLQKNYEQSNVLFINGFFDQKHKTWAAVTVGV